MTDKEIDEGAVANTADYPSAKQHGLFGSAGIQLSSEELTSSATTKFLRHLNSVQEIDINKLRSFESQYYDKRQECEVLKKEKEGIEKELQSKKELENIQKVMITVGGLILGALKFIEGQPWYLLALLALTSVVLIIGGMFPVLRIGASK